MRICFSDYPACAVNFSKNRCLQALCFVSSSHLLPMHPMYIKLNIALWLLLGCASIDSCFICKVSATDINHETSSMDLLKRLLPMVKNEKSFNNENRCFVVILLSSYPILNIPNHPLHVQCTEYCNETHMTSNL